MRNWGKTLLATPENLEEGYRAVEFAKWAREFFLCSALTGELCSDHLLDSNGKSVRNKLREFGLLSEPEPTDTEKLAAAEKRIKELEAEHERDIRHLIQMGYRQVPVSKPPRSPWYNLVSAKPPRKPEDVSNNAVFWYLVEQHTCGEAIRWVREHGGNLAELWRDCKDGDWMNWWLVKCGIRKAFDSAQFIRRQVPVAPIPKELQ